MRTLAMKPLGAIDHAHGLLVWRWFRAALVELYGLETLPEAFTESEGVRSAQTRLDPDDPDAFWRAAEFNYTFDSRRLEFTAGELRVALTIEVSDRGDFVLATLRDPARVEHHTLFHGTRFRSRLELHDANPHGARWTQLAASFPEISQR